MFTGLIEATGIVERAERAAAGVRFIVAKARWEHRPAIGDSISVNGCCLTVAELVAGGGLAFDVVPETLAKTTLGGLAAGSRVNLEHAATASTLLGGHVVQGHVDGVGEVAGLTTAPEYRLRISPAAELMEFMTPKGSVAIDGVSLTLAAVNPEGGWIEVALIPVTLGKTTLGELRAGGRCNIECDVMAKTIVHWLRNYGR